MFMLTVARSTPINDAIYMQCNVSPHESMHFTELMRAYMHITEFAARRKRIATKSIVTILLLYMIYVAHLDNKERKHIGSVCRMSRSFSSWIAALLYTQVCKYINCS